MGVAVAECRDLRTIKNDKKKEEKEKNPTVRSIDEIHRRNALPNARVTLTIGRIPPREKERERETEEQLDRINYIQSGLAYNIDRAAWTSMNGIISANAGPY